MNNNCLPNLALCTFYFRDHNKSSQLNDKGNGQLFFFIVETVFHSFEINQTSETLLTMKFKIFS